MKFEQDKNVVPSVKVMMELFPTVITHEKNWKKLLNLFKKEGVLVATHEWVNSKGGEDFSNPTIFALTCYKLLECGMSVALGSASYYDNLASPLGTRDEKLKKVYKEECAPLQNLLQTLTQAARNDLKWSDLKGLIELLRKVLTSEALVSPILSLMFCIGEVLFVKLFCSCRCIWRSFLWLRKRFLGRVWRRMCRCSTRRICWMRKTASRLLCAGKLVLPSTPWYLTVTCLFATYMCNPFLNFVFSCRSSV